MPDLSDLPPVLREAFTKLWHAIERRERARMAKVQRDLFEEMGR